IKEKLCYSRLIMNRQPRSQAAEMPVLDRSDYPDLSRVPPCYHDLREDFNKTKATSLPPGHGTAPLTFFQEPPSQNEKTELSSGSFLDSSGSISPTSQGLNTKPDALSRLYEPEPASKEPEPIVPPDRVVGVVTWQIEMCNMLAVVNLVAHMSPGGQKNYVCGPAKVLSVDFVTGLPPSRGNTVVLTVVDRFSKMAHFIPLPKLPSAKVTAKVMINHVFRIHVYTYHVFRFPCDIVSDRGPQFISHFWKDFCQFLGATISLTSGYHSESNGKTAADQHRRPAPSYAPGHK
ncbi:hypothetical protein L3Q82_022664, partial [Scortum barcoo]